MGHGNRWRGGRHVRTDGYIDIWVPKGTPGANKAGGSWFKKEHVLVTEAALGHPLPKGAEVHHVNGNRGDNRPQNLVICEDKKYHRLLHVRAEALKATGNPNYWRCTYCGRWDDPANMLIHKPKMQYDHRECRRAAARRSKSG